jgi:hypothetical protein
MSPRPFARAAYGFSLGFAASSPPKSVVDVRGYEVVSLQALFVPARPEIVRKISTAYFASYAGLAWAACSLHWS